MEILVFHFLSFFEVHHLFCFISFAPGPICFKDGWLVVLNFGDNLFVSGVWKAECASRVDQADFGLDGEVRIMDGSLGDGRDGMNANAL